MTLGEIRAILRAQTAGNYMLLSFISYDKISICRANFYFAPSKLFGPELTIDVYNKAISMMFALL